MTSTILRLAGISLLLTMVLNVSPPEARAEETATAVTPDVHPAPTPRAAWQPIASSDPRVLYSVGAHVRGLFIPSFVLSPFLDKHNAVNSVAVGAEVSRRRGSLEGIATLDLGFYAPSDGNFLGSGKDAALDTHYVQFKTVNMLSLDVGVMWHHDLTQWLAFMAGGAIGIGIFFNDIYSINNSSQVCTSANAGDPGQCYPVTASGTAIRPSDPDFQRKLDQNGTEREMCLATPGADCRDTAGHPYYHKVKEIPPVLPVISLLVGFKVKLHRHLNFNLSGGFRNGFVFGGGPEYVF